MGEKAPDYYYAKEPKSERGWFAKREGARFEEKSEKRVAPRCIGRNSFLRMCGELRAREREFQLLVAIQFYRIIEC